MTRAIIVQHSRLGWRVLILPTRPSYDGVVRLLCSGPVWDVPSPS
jgi:hypothetical protein